MLQDHMRPGFSTSVSPSSRVGTSSRLLKRFFPQSWETGAQQFPNWFGPIHEQGLWLPNTWSDWKIASAKSCHEVSPSGWLKRETMRKAAFSSTGLGFAPRTWLIGLMGSHEKSPDSISAGMTSAILRRTAWLWAGISKLLSYTVPPLRQ